MLIGLIALLDTRRSFFVDTFACFSVQLTPASKIGIAVYMLGAFLVGRGTSILDGQLLLNCTDVSRRRLNLAAAAVPGPPAPDQAPQPG
ncbi:hypothetical protein [Streptomyces sp. NPDC003710]